MDCLDILKLPEKFHFLGSENQKTKENKQYERMLAHYNERLLIQNTAIKPIDFESLTLRSLHYLVENHDDKPHNIFFFSVNGHRFVGRKSLSQLNVEKRIEEMECAHIMPHMFLGLFEREQMSEDAVIVFYKPLELGEKRYLFDLIQDNLMTDLYFPYPFLIENHREFVCPTEMWNEPEKIAENMNAGETLYREYAIKYLEQFQLSGKTIYDPACSTGEFLHSIKMAYPEVYTIGQDINPNMVNYAKSKVDEIACAGAANPVVPSVSVDFIMIRFLNSQVVSVKDAYQLFPKIVDCCKEGGIIIMLGHTPTILPSEWVESLGFDILQRIGFMNDSIFQFYVFRKNGAVLHASYTDLNESLNG